MEDHQPSAIPLYEDAGSEIWSVAYVAVCGSSHCLLCSKNPSDITFDLDRKLIHRNYQLV